MTEPIARGWVIMGPQGVITSVYDTTELAWNIANLPPSLTSAPGALGVYRAIRVAVFEEKDGE